MPNVVAKWRNAVSVVETSYFGKPQWELQTFDPKQGVWVKLLYFTKPEDFSSFMDFMSEAEEKINPVPQEV